MALATYIPPSASVTTIRAQSEANIEQKWAKGAILQADNQDDLSQLEGKEGSEAAIHIKQELTAGGGDRVYFNTFGELGGSGKLGSDELVGYTEQPIENSFYVDIDAIRHGVSSKALTKQMTATGRSRQAIEVELLGRWFGRKKKWDALMKMILAATAGNTLRPDGKARDALKTADDMSAAFISDSGSFLTTLNASPANIGKATSGADIHGYLFYSDQVVFKPLKVDDTYLQATRYADVRGTDNVLFKGGFRQWDANVIWDSKVPDLTSYGPLGGPLAPKALLGAASSGTTVDFSASNNAVVMYGSGKNRTDLGDYSAYFEPFRLFPGYAYQFVKKTTPSADSSTRYGIIYDPADRKWMAFTYTGSDNIGTQITVDTRLAVATATKRQTTLMGFAYSPTYNKEVFPVGTSWIIPTNAIGVPFGYTLALGRGGLYRAFGMDKMSRIKHVDDFEEDEGVGIRSIYGQNVPVDALGRVRNYLLLETAVAHPGMGGLPVVT